MVEDEDEGLVALAFELSLGEDRKPLVADDIVPIFWRHKLCGSIACQ